jgi:hypothetical protein
VSEVHRSPWVDDEIADLKQMATKFFEAESAPNRVLEYPITRMYAETTHPTQETGCM